MDERVSVKIKERRLDGILKKFSKSMEGEITFNDNVITIVLDNHIGKGTITGYKFSPGLDAILYDVQFKTEVSMEIEFQKLNPVYFIYCLEGFLLHRFEADADYTTFDTLQNIIIKSGEGKKNIVMLPPNVTLKICVVHVVKEKIAAHTEGPFHYLCDKIEDMLSSFPKNELFDHAGPLSPNTVVHVKNLLNTNRSDAVGKLFTEACILNILSSQIANHDSISSNETSEKTLAKHELSAILSVSNFIQDNLSEKLTLKKLTQLTGLTATVLQSGFLTVYGTTIHDYIRNLRLETAIDLVNSTDLTLSEITYRIGLSSKSYFSKLFKTRYGILPSDYRKSRAAMIAI